MNIEIYTSHAMAEQKDSSKSKISESKFHNWIKSGLAIMYARNGLQPFVMDEITSFQQTTYTNVLTVLGLATNTKCSACPTDALVCDKVFEKCKRKTCSSFHRTCPQSGLCSQVKDKIIKAHRYHGPSWINTDAQLWCSDPWQVAKCYMPREGYSTQMSAEETDFNGIASVILNHENFSQRLSADLTDRNNIFREARDVSKLVRHSSLFEVEDEDFQNNIDVLTKVLQEKQIAKYQEAQGAMQKLSELRTSKWSIFTSKDDIFAVMKSACTEKAEPDTAEEKEKVEMMKIAMEVIEANTGTDVKSVIWQMQHSFNKYEEEKEQKRKRKEICRRLIQTYQLECSTLPISALFEEEDAPLLNFYVQPMMQQIDYHNLHKYHATVKSYYDIFHKDNQLCKNIYITVNAGTGKTAVCQRMVLCWCHAQTSRIADDHFSQEDIDSMKRFDFLFFVSLRDTELCHVEAMIQQQLLSTDKVDLLDQILENEKCLIILDGLDEWSHPKSATFCPVNKKVPHRKAHGKCVYLTTSRPWKLETHRLKTTEIDQQIELKGLDEIASQKLTSFVVEYLNRKYLENRNPREFQAFLEQKKQLESISGIPIIKIQLISLWFLDIDISTNYSRCAIYADTVEMLFSRAIEREEYQQTASRLSEKVKQSSITKCEEVAPESISNLAQLSEFLHLLYKIGNLAFDMLFRTPEGMSPLVFKRNVGKNYELSDIEMEFLLFVGILSKNKVIGPHQDRLIKLTFLHKSYQEYFAALYISMNKDIGSIVKSLFSKCNSLAEFLKYEQMFVFLSGMNVEVMEHISANIRKMVSVDRCVNEYRQTAYYKFGMVVVLKPYNSEMLEHGWNGESSLRALQTLMLHCLEESDYSGYKPVELPLSDIFIGEEYTPDLKKLLDTNTHHLKSVSTDVFTSDLSSLRMLEKLVVNENIYSCRVDIEQYDKCISSSRTSLVSLSLANCKGRVDLSTHSFKNLTSLALFDVLLKHEEVQEVFNFISKTVALTQLFLYEIKCSDHEDECSGSKLDLSRHSDLQFVRFQKLYQHGSYETKLNNTNLKFLLVEGNAEGQVVGSVIEDIRNATKLTELDLLGMKAQTLIDSIINSLPTLQSLEKVSFINIDFGDCTLQMNAENKQPIKMVNFFHTSLSLQSFCRFVDSLPVKGVIVYLQACKVSSAHDERTTEENMEDAADYVRGKGTFEVTLTDRSSLAFNSKS